MPLYVSWFKRQSLIVKRSLGTHQRWSRNAPRKGSSRCYRNGVRHTGTFSVWHCQGRNTQRHTLRINGLDGQPRTPCPYNQPGQWQQGSDGGQGARHGQPPEGQTMASGVQPSCAPLLSAARTGDSQSNRQVVWHSLLRYPYHSPGGAVHAAGSPGIRGGKRRHEALSGRRQANRQLAGAGGHAAWVSAACQRSCNQEVMTPQRESLASDPRR
jgi:hypothetical protein